VGSIIRRLCVVNNTNEFATYIRGIGVNIGQIFKTRRFSRPTLQQRMQLLCG